jgi:NADPH:quinone reductase-like Zn-dependent oxidoreductase
MKSAMFDRFGPPEEVLHVREVPTPEPGRGQVRVRMIASPINPSDLLHIRGEYGKRPVLPGSAGFEGVGIVEASGGGLLGWRVKGRRVAVINSSGGNWSEQVVVPARQAIPVPAAMSDDQAATFFVNPASALVMTRHVLNVPPGAWLLQTAANGALGRIVIRLGKQYGFRTINVVRRQEHAEKLSKLGADAVVVVPGASLTEEVKRITGGQGVGYALDAVGGPLAGEVVGCLGTLGRLLVYGTLSEEPLCLSPRVLMVGQKRVEGFWLSEWSRRQSVLTMLRLFRKVGKLFQEGIATTEFAATYPLDQVREATHHAAGPGRNGKVLLQITGSAS